MQKKWAYYNEIDPYAAQFLKNLMLGGLIAPGEVDTRSIEDVQPDDYRSFTQVHWFAGIGCWSYAARLAGVSDNQEFWSGSCPCQPFSAAGKGAGFDDERHLWPALFHHITVARPKRVFGEQVAGKNGLAWLDLVSADLEGNDYACRAVPLCSAGFGASDIRNRLYWCADRLGSPSRQGLEGRDARALGGQCAPAERASSVRADGLADRIGSERPDADRRERDAGFTGRWIEDPSQAAGRGVPGRLAHHHHHERGDGRPASDEQTGPGQLTQHRDAGRLADGQGGGWREKRPDARGLAVGDRAQGNAARPVDGRVSDHAGGPGPVNGFWRDADWLFCRDGKWRPVEPGASPLAARSPGRVGALRAYGNAINAQVASEFIRAVMEEDRT